MKVSHSLCLVLSTWTTVVMAQKNSKEPLDLSGFDPDSIQWPADGLNYVGCFKDMIAADANGDGVIKRNEYLFFIQQYGIRICHNTDTLTLEQNAAFNTIACGCNSIEGGAADCCLGSNAQIKTHADAVIDPTLRTPEILFDMIRTCRITDSVIYEPRGCDPQVIPPDDPPPFGALVPGPVTAAAPPASSGLTDGQLAGIIVGAILGFLLLLCCCCCCVVRRRKQEEEEEDELQKTAVVAETAEDGRPEQSPEPTAEDGGSVDPRDALAALGPAAVAAAMAPTDGESDEEEEEGARGTGMMDDEEEEEEITKGRGSAMIPPEDEESGYPRWGGPQYPPEDPERDGIRLNPIDPEDPEEDPDWDQPGRQIDFPKDKDEMSAGEVEHYEPDGGVYDPQRDPKEPLNWRNKWERPEQEDPDEYDNRKHRIQAGLGEGEVWNKLGEDETETPANTGGGDAFDWVVSSALNVLGNSEEAGNLADK